MLRTEPQGSANEDYKQEAFYPARGALFTTAVQMYSALFSVRTELLRSNKLISKSINYESERGVLFRAHPNFGQYNAFSGVFYVGFPSFFSPILRCLNISSTKIEHAS